MNRLLCIIFLFCYFDLQGQIVINELAPSNDETIADEDGEYEDWIELYNSGSNPVNLIGYGLTDDGTVGKWKFPQVILPANGYLLVFASGKNRPPGPEIPMVDHWETAINDFDTWKYLVPTSDLSNDWTSLTFDDSPWLSGQGGFGYKTGDDSTLIQFGCRSVYTRKTFSVTDKSKLVRALLSIDYDDGFIAYLNGKEIARNGLIGYPPPFNDFAAIDHEAVLYQGLIPESFPVDYTTLQDIILNGSNVLAIEVHNAETSQDFSDRPFLHFGIGDNTNCYGSNPDWFTNPEFELHANFKLSNGETILLSDSSNNIIDSRTISELHFGDVNASIPDGSVNWCISNLPSPSSSNDDATCSGEYSEEPILTPEAGFYTAGQTISMTASLPNTVIRYSMNGDIPGGTSPIYTTPIHIDSTTVIRARCFNSGNILPGKTVTNTYFINEQFHFPVISLITDSLNLWDYSNGIYVLGAFTDSFPNYTANFWKEIEKKAHIEYFDTLHQKIFEQQIGLEIDGGWSRAFPQKSFLIKAGTGTFGTGDIDYELLPDKNFLTSFETFRLRAGIQFYNGATDGFSQRLFKNTNAGYEAYAPVILYLNGAYWGIYELREREDGYYVEHNYGINHDSVDILSVNSGFDYFLKLHPVEGSDSSFYTAHDFIVTNDPTDSLYFNACDNYLDLENFSDYLICETWADNADWITSYNNNVKLWHPQQPAGQWKYLFHDLDKTFLYSAAKTIQNIRDAEGPHGELFNSLLLNEDFKNYFINRYADLLNTTFQSSFAGTLWSQMQDELLPEWHRYYERWAAGDPTHTFSLEMPDVGDVDMLAFKKEEVLTYIEARIPETFNQLLNMFDLNAEVTLELVANPPGTGVIQINTIIPEPLPWKGIYFDGVPVVLTAIPNDGYAFVNWSGNLFIADTLNPSFTNNINSDETFTANFIADPLGISFPGKQQISLYPNPTSDYLEIAGNASALISSAKVLEMSGKVLLEEKNKILDVHTLPAGMYLVQLFDKNSTLLYSGKFVKQ